MKSVHDRLRPKRFGHNRRIFGSKRQRNACLCIQAERCHGDVARVARIRNGRDFRSQRAALFTGVGQDLELAKPVMFEIVGKNLTVCRNLVVKQIIQ